MARPRSMRINGFIKNCWLESLLLFSGAAIPTLALILYNIPLFDYVLLLLGSLGFLFLPFYVSCFIPKE